jgi:hypothetical protein
VPPISTREHASDAAGDAAPKLRAIRFLSSDCRAAPSTARTSSPRSSVAMTYVPSLRKTKS